jgi:hypothetical protein
MLKIILLFAMPAMLAAVAATSLAFMEVTRASLEAIQPETADRMLVTTHLQSLQDDLALPKRRAAASRCPGRI